MLQKSLFILYFMDNVKENVLLDKKFKYLISCWLHVLVDEFYPPCQHFYLSCGCIAATDFLLKLIINVIWFSFYLSIYLSIYLYISIYLSMNVSICLSLSIYFCMCVGMCVCKCVCVSVCKFAYLCPLGWVNKIETLTPNSNS